PRLAGVNEISAWFDRIRHASQGPAYRRVLRKQLIKSGDHSQGRARSDGRHGGAIEGIALLELRNRLESLPADQRCALTHVDLAEISQQNMVRLSSVSFDGI